MSELKTKRRNFQITPAAGALMAMALIGIQPAFAGAPIQATSTGTTTAVDGYASGTGASSGHAGRFESLGQLEALQGIGSGAIGVSGFSASNNAVDGRSQGSGASGVYGQNNHAGGFGMAARNSSGCTTGCTGAAIFIDTGVSTGEWSIYSNASGASYFGGNIAKPGGSFVIDHPLDPANKLLFHSFVESPDMKNLYDGVVTLGADGTATVELPDYFEALNKDFRYQLTCVGGYAPVFIGKKLSEHRFTIAGGQKGLEVSWQVTGTRKDDWAQNHRIPTEVWKEPANRGKYLHPKEAGMPAEMQLSTSTPTWFDGIRDIQLTRPAGPTSLKSFGGRR